MQPFDPKLFENQNSPSRKLPGTSTDRAVDRARESDEGRKKKAKKFSLDEGKEEKKKKEKVAKEEKSDLPSAFSLASRPPKKAFGEKKEEYDPDEVAAREEVLEEEQESREKVKSRERSDFARPDSQQEQMANASLAAAQRAAGTAKTSQAQADLMMRMLAKNISIMKSEGKTETTITIKNLPLFNDAKVTITAFDTAKGEYNITFSELSAQAKQLLDSQAVRNDMLRHLEEKGYLVHIMVTTTEKEEILTAEAPEHAEHGEEKEGEEKEEREKEEE